MQIDELLEQARNVNASDLLLVPNRPPCAYIHGRLTAIAAAALDAAHLESILLEFMTPAQREQLATTGDADFSYGQSGVGRVRINVHRQRGTCAAAIRFINTRNPSFEELHLPPRLADLAGLTRGLVLVTGSTGSGKSTTLAAMIEYMNQRLDRHIITLEDPIEFLFTHNRCVIEQREIGQDSPSFAQALRHVVRQKPDVILVGEMRDRETIATALTAAETGHLVLATLHTSSAAQTIDRIIDVFDAGQQPQIRVQLAASLRAVICQTLLRSDNGVGMLPALEILISTSAIRRAIRDRETHLIPGMIETGSRLGMCALDHSLARLVSAGRVSAETARARALDPDRFDKLVAAAQEPGALATSPLEFVTDALLPEPATTGSASTKPWH